MKRIFTLLLTVSIFAVNGQVPFTQGNVVVYRVGDGVAPLRGVSTRVFLDEYSPSGTLVQSIVMPRVASGANNALTAYATSTTEGFINLSVNRKYIVLGGYNSDTGVASISSSTSIVTKRVIGRIDNAANLNTSTVLDSAFSGYNIRSVTSTDGNSFWMSGSGSGVRRTTLGVSADTRVTTAQSAYPGNYRNIGIYGGQLYATTGSGTTYRMVAIGSGTPIDSGNVLTQLPGIPITGSPNQFYFADLNATIPGVDVLYIADESASTSGGGVQKYSFDGTTWVANGAINPAVTPVKGLTGVVSGTTVTLYVVGGAAKLYSLVDASGYNTTMTASFTEMATAPANTAFRGVALAPEPLVAPVTLISFAAVLSKDGVEVSWKTNNEENVREYVIERSSDGRNFSSNIDKKVASNRSEAFYTIKDVSPIKGMNYYRLKVFDNDGSFKYSEVASVNTVRNTKLSVFPNPVQDNVKISHSKASVGATIKLLTTDGQQVKTFNVQSGAVQTSLIVNDLSRGHYIIVFENDGEKSTTKFIKQ